MSGAFPWTDISEMELVAAVEALRSTVAGSRVELYSDSEFLILGMHGFVFRWESQDGATVAVSHFNTEICGSNSLNSISL
jgi:ribonuclease HI